MNKLFTAPLFLRNNPDTAAVVATGFKSENIEEIAFSTTHQDLWQQIIDRQLPCATIIFEKVVFHPQFADLAPDLFDATPDDWDMIALGNWLQHSTDKYIDRQPTARSFAYALTLAGAEKLLKRFPTPCPSKALELDIFNCMIETPLTFTWYCWSGLKFECELGDETGTGLVFVDNT